MIAAVAVAVAVAAVVAVAAAAAVVVVVVVVVVSSSNNIQECNDRRWGPPVKCLLVINPMNTKCRPSYKSA